MNDFIFLGFIFISIVLIILVVDSLRLENRIIELEKKVELNRINNRCSDIKNNLSNINKVNIGDVYRAIDLKLSAHDLDKSCKEYKEFIERKNLNK